MKGFKRDSAEKVGEKTQSGRTATKSTAVSEKKNGAKEQMNLDVNQQNEETEEGKNSQGVRREEGERERESHNAKRELSDLGWKWELGARVGRVWWRSVVVQKSSSARRQRVRRGP